MAPANPSLLSALLLCCSLRHAAAGEVSITLNRPGLPVTRDALTIFSPAMESHGPVTSHTTVTLPQPVVVSVVGACASLSPAASELVGKTALVLNTAACDGHGAGAILGLLAAGQDATSGSGEILAVLGHDDPHGDAPEPNWSALPSSIQPTFLHNRHGHVYSVPVAWATQLRDVLAPLGGADGVALSVTPIVTPLAVGVPVEGSAYAHHMAYYSFVNPTPTDHDGSVILTVTPTVGDPDLYVNQGAAPEAIPLPAAFQGGSDAQQTSPGDDAMGLTLPAACVIGVWGSSGFASNFSILASTPSTSVPLLSGKPRRFEMRTAGEVRVPARAGEPRIARQQPRERPFT